jgi:hypothetical protein
MDQRYKDGIEVRVGEFISYNGQKGTIVFVADRNEYSQAYPQSEWRDKSGFMIEFTNGALLFLDSVDGFVERLSISN